MKKILFILKVILSIFMVMVAALSLSSFDGAIDLFFGAISLLLGAVFGVFLEKKYWRAFFLLSILSFLIVLSLQFFPLLPHVQYFFGGLLVYFACAVAFGRNKIDVNKKMC